MKPSISRAKSQDIRYLARLDHLTFPQDDLSERLEHWRAWPLNDRNELRSVWVARYVGLYVGYLALMEVETPIFCIQARFEVDEVKNELLIAAQREMLQSAPLGEAANEVA